MYGVGGLQQRAIHDFNQFQIYDNIAEKGVLVALMKEYISIKIPDLGCV